MSTLLSRLGIAAHGDDPELIIHRLKLLSQGHNRSFAYALALMGFTTLVALPKLSNLALIAGMGTALAFALLRAALSRGMMASVIERNVGLLRRRERMVAGCTLAMGIYSGLLIAWPPALPMPRQALLVVLALAVPLSSLASMASSPMSWFALITPLLAGAVWSLAYVIRDASHLVLAGYLAAALMICEVGRSYLKLYFEGLRSVLRERGLVAQQWALFDTSQLGIALAQEGRIGRMNARLQSWFAPDGNSSTFIAELAARSGRSLPRIEALLKRADERVTGHASYSFELSLNGGNPSCVEVQVRRFDPLNHSRGLLWTFSDHSAEFVHRQALERDAQRDSLTGVLNRRGLLTRLIPMLSRDLTQRPLAVVCLDLNGFKPLNDRHGHAFGDRVLCTVAQRLQNALRNSDFVARCGGDEFIVVLDPLDDLATATTVAERLGELIAVPMLLEGIGCEIQAAMGIAIAPTDGADPESLLRRADRAMYEVKRAVSPGRPRSTSQNSPDPRFRR